MSTTRIYPNPEQPQLLDTVRLRLIERDERERWERLVCEHHYLPDATMAGRSLRYVAEANGAWIALLGWNSAAYHLKAREAWIGWSPAQRQKRLALVAQNSRFLMSRWKARWSRPTPRIPSRPRRGIWRRTGEPTMCWWSRTTSKPFVNHVKTGCPSRPFPPERTQVENGRGRIEHRAARSLPVEAGEISFPFVAQIARVDRKRELAGGQTTGETVFIVTSLSQEQASEARLATLVRRHWAIENQLHDRCDWSFDEDRCRIRNPNGAQVMAALRNLAISWPAGRHDLAPRRRARTLPQLQRQGAKSLRAAIAAATTTWK